MAATTSLTKEAYGKNIKNILGMHLTTSSLRSNQVTFHSSTTIQSAKKKRY